MVAALPVLERAFLLALTSSVTNDTAISVCVCVVASDVALLGATCSLPIVSRTKGEGLDYSCSCLPKHADF